MSSRPPSLNKLESKIERLEDKVESLSHKMKDSSSHKKKHRKPSEYNLFMKSKLKQLYKANKSIPISEHMKTVSEMWNKRASNKKK